MADYTYKYASDFDRDTPKLLEYLFNGGKDKAKISKMLDHGLSLIEQLYDCSDFRIEILTRILLGYNDVIGKENEKKILSTLTKFPFNDNSCHSMCTWTENHQLILDVSEYLLGNKYPTLTFYNNTSGRELAIVAYSHLNDWCEFIFRFGFSEYGSCNYYPETLGALGNIIEFSGDNDLTEKFKIILDLMLYDIFSSITPDLTYNKATSRAYHDNKINYYNYLKPHILSLLNKEVKVCHEREACFFLMLRKKGKYTLPKVFLDIFNTKERELKESNGLNGDEYRENGLLEYKDANMRYIMTTGTSGSYIALKNIARYLNKEKMWEHSFFSRIKPYRHVLRINTFLFHLIRKSGKSKFADVSYARGNTYTYVNNKYSLSSLTRYQINKPAFQQVTHVINLDGLGVFTTSPASSMEVSGSPDYWVGNKKNPDCIQYKNILIAYYKNPKLTHIYFPLEKFDKVNLDNLNKGIIFAQYHGINLLISTNNNLYFADSSNDHTMKSSEKTLKFNLTKYDLVNKNKGDHYYIFEVNDNLSFEDFIKVYNSNLPIINKKNISYKGMKYSYNKECYFADKEIEINYPRFESKFILGGKYIYSKHNPLTFISNKNKLTIDFNSYKRKEEVIK